MRVLHVMPSVARAFGGPTESLLGYLEAGRRAGIAGDVVAPACGAEDERRFRERAAEGELTTLPAVGRGPLATSPAMLRWLDERADRYDVVHVHGLLNLVSTLAARRAVQAGRALVVRPFGTLSRYTFEHRRSGAKRLYFRTLDVPALRSAGAVHYTTEEERDEAEWHGLGLAERGHVVPPPWVPAAAAPARDPGRPGRRVLFLSRLHPKKGLDVLLDAWDLVRSRVPGAELVLAGSGDASYVARIEARVMRMRADASGARVRLAGFVTADAKAAAFASADVFVLPSFHENFGVAVLEAVASGLPVVVSPDVQLASFVRRHAVGLVAPREPAALADALVAALGDAALRSRAAASGPALVGEHFSPVSVGEGLGAMYEAALARNGALQATRQ